MNIRPDGGAVAWIDVIQRPKIICPFPPCGRLERNLIALDAGKPAAQSVIVAEGPDVRRLARRSLLRQAFGDGEKPWFICTVTASAGCVRSVAVDRARWLDDPAGSADGKRVAAVARSGSGGHPGGDGPIVLFDAATGKRLRDLTTGADRIRRSARTPSASRSSADATSTPSRPAAARAAAGQERVQPVLGAALTRRDDP